VATPVSEASKVESALADLLAQTQERAGITQQPPSEALIDELVDLVHNEPASLSVFTSGSAFIHGVGSHHESADRAPDTETQSTAPQTMNGAAAPKLDRNAAELLRPMLRQWLADNMPRIVEEALRSELMSSQAAPKDSDKG
jgi:cell pole-organizing protein PopZ